MEDIGDIGEEGMQGGRVWSHSSVVATSLPVTCPHLDPLVCKGKMHQAEGLVMHIGSFGGCCGCL